jgi:hypothetical protein
MKPTLEEIKDNYERVLLQLENGHLAGIKRLRSEDYYVVEQQDWNSLAVAITLSRGYNRVSDYGYNIDRIKFLDAKNELTDFMDYGSDTDITDWDWDINTLKVKMGANEVTCDDGMDAYEYAIQMLGLNSNPHNRDYIIKGEKQNMMNEILEIYEEKQLRKINKKYDDLEQLIKQTDERYKVWLECTTTLNKLYAEDKICNFAHSNINLSEDTKKKLCTIVYDKREEELRKFYSKKAEVNAQLSMCETYDQKQEILRRYNIINKNGKVNG